MKLPEKVKYGLGILFQVIAASPYVVYALNNPDTGAAIQNVLQPFGVPPGLTQAVLTLVGAALLKATHPETKLLKSETK